MKLKRKNKTLGPKRCVQLDEMWDRWMIQRHNQTQLSFKAVIQEGFRLLKESNGSNGRG